MTEDEYIMVSNKQTLIHMNELCKHLMPWGSINETELKELRTKIYEMMDKSFGDCKINE